MRKDTATILGELWADALGLDDMPGPDADFLDLGGTSLKARRLLQMIEDRFATRVAMVELFLAPTLLAVTASGPGLDEFDDESGVVLDFQSWRETPRSKGYLRRLAEWEERKSRKVVPSRRSSN